MKFATLSLKPVRSLANLGGFECLSGCAIPVFFRRHTVGVLPALAWSGGTAAVAAPLTAQTSGAPATIDSMPLRVLGSAAGEFRDVLRAATPTHRRLRDHLVTISVATAGVDRKS